MHSIVVFIDHRPETSARMREAVELALRERARLTLLAAIPTVPAFTWVPPAPAPESPSALRRACERECEALLRRYAAEVPASVSVTMSARRARAHAALLDEVREHDHDMVVLGPAPSGVLGLLARRRHSRFLRRCPARVLAIPDPGDAASSSRPRVVDTARPKRRSAPRSRALAARTRRGAGT